MNEREKELDKLIAWSKENPKDWNRICNLDSCDISVEYISELVEKLYKENFLSIIYLNVHTNQIIREVEWAVDITKKECFIDIPKNILIDRFRHNPKMMMGDTKNKYVQLTELACAMHIVEMIKS